MPQPESGSLAGFTTSRAVPIGRSFATTDALLELLARA